MGTTLKLDTSGLDAYLKRLASLGGDVRAAAEKALREAAEQIRDDTLEALSAPHLPAGGKYSTNPSQTKESVVTDTTPKWEGQTAWVPVGFDYSKPGAGGYLISGTPKMDPDKQLNKMYRGKKYMRAIQDDIADAILAEIAEAMEK